MYKHVRISIRLSSYVDDEVADRELTAEFSGSSESKPWLNLQLHGGQLTENELAGLNKMMAGFNEMVEG